MDLVENTYDNIADAIGWAAIEECEIIGTARTRNAGLILDGFTQTLFVMAAGIKYTVHEDPKAGRYACAHMSSIQPDG